MKYFFYYPLIFSTLLLYNCNQKKVNHPIFKLISSNQTNINFNNKITSTDAVNIINFEYMFNGGGVGIGDVNNDGLQDIFFTGNQVSSALYLNKGDLNFEDITKKAKVSTNGWSNGVSFSDVNNDGFLDIYICKGGPRGTPESDMENILFINNGDGTFSNKAQEMGVNDNGYSIQAVFFDYDKDGDKDLYILTNALVSFNRNTSRTKIIDGSAISTDRLYQNNGDGTFSDVSKQAGVTIEGFGLGVSVCDINNDGWLDVYVSNDFLTNDILYINNKNGTFSNKIADYIKHQSFNGMGMNISDINNDGHSDIIVLDMLPEDNKRKKQTMGYLSYDKHMQDINLGYSPQYVRNTLQLNNGNGGFSEIGQLAGIHSTDWSWAPLIADFDNDGWKDVFITNGYRRDVTNLDFIVYGKQSGPFGTKEAIRKEKLKKLKSLPEVKLKNYFYKNNKDYTFTNTTNDWGITTPSYSNGAAYADLDNDGDLDLVVNNIDDEAHILENLSNHKTAKNFIKIKLASKNDITGAKISLYSNDNSQYHFVNTVTGYLSNVEDIAHFGLDTISKIDSLIIRWPNKKKQVLKDISVNKTITVTDSDANILEEAKINSETLFTKLYDSIFDIPYVHKNDRFIDFKLQPTITKMVSKLGPGIAVGDVNGDNKEDFFVGGSKNNNGCFYIQQQNETFSKKELKNSTGYEDMGTLLLDYDGDEDLDLLVVDAGYKGKSANYENRIYINNGKGEFTKQTLLNTANSGSCITASDFDKDGDLDLFIGGRVVYGAYPKSPKSYLLVNENGKYIDATKQILGNQNIGMVSDAIWTDFDNDQWIDLIIVGEYMPLKFYKNNHGKFTDVTETTGLKNTNGWWNSIVSGDFDMDGDTDYIVGNFGLNNDYNATENEPVTLYAKDFDANGSIDPLMSCFRNHKEHLVHPRDVLIDQISGMRNRFRTYESYANASMKQTLSSKEIKDAQILKAYNFNSSYIENIGNGKFKLKALPVEAQFAPLYGLQVADYNNDGHLDVLGVGNLFSVNAFTGRYDALNGICLLGDGKGNFTALTSNKSGLSVTGDAKSLVNIQLDNKEIVLVSQNNDFLQAYTVKNNKKTIKIKPEDAYALVYLKNGKTYKEDLSYGGSYLGHSSRVIKVDPLKTKHIEIIAYTGKKRQINF